jgi:hypothetical protein
MGMCESAKKWISCAMCVKCGCEGVSWLEIRDRGSAAFSRQWALASDGDGGAKSSDMRGGW